MGVAAGTPARHAAFALVRLLELNAKRHAIRRSTLADANETRNWRIWSNLAAMSIRRARRLCADEPVGLDLDSWGCSVLTKQSAGGADAIEILSLSSVCANPHDGCHSIICRVATSRYGLRGRSSSSHRTQRVAS